MELSDKIQYLHRIIKGVKSGDICSNGIFDRMFAIGVISIFNDINRLLEKLIIQLDSELNIDAVSIDFDKYLDKDIWTDNWLFRDLEKAYIESNVPFSQGIKQTTEINQMMDYFPNGKEGYFFTPNTMESLKMALHQMTDGSKLAERDVFYALNAGLDKMLNLLAEAKEKTRNPQKHLYSKLWYDICYIYDNDEFDKGYTEWKQENEGYTFENLITRRKQEIYKLLCSNFFRFCTVPAGAEVRNCSLKISKDDLPVDTVIPQNIDVECAKLSKYIIWKGKTILSIDYEKLGLYIYKNYQKFDELEFYKITDFDRINDVINEDMARMKPELAPLLKSFDENIGNLLYDECVSIINTCKIHLADGIRQNILQDYLRKLLFDKEMKEEARKKLGGGSRKVYICEMVAALRNVHIFKPQSDNKVLAKSLHEKMDDIKESTIEKNIERAYSKNDGALYHWTVDIIDKLKRQPDNPFEGII